MVRLLVQALMSLSCASASLHAQGFQHVWSAPAGVNTGADAGDADGDGRRDWALGRPGAGTASFGTVSLRSGIDGAELRAISSPTAGDGYGSAIATLGDADGDGRDDLAVSAPYFVGTTPARVEARSGATGALLWQRVDPSFARMYGAALARIADLDGDGRDELAAGSPASAGSGEVQVLSGANGATLFVLATPPGTVFGFGTSVVACGDLDGDQREDLAVGDPLSGRVTLHSGFAGALLRTIWGPSADGRFGQCVAALDDLDGDGVREIAIAAPLEIIVVGSSWGRVRVHSGATGALLRTIEGGPGLVRFGESIDRAGDFDGDGKRDLLLAAGSYKIGCCTYATAEARVYSTASWTVLVQGASQSGPFVRSVPDANGDGRDDWLAPSLYAPNSAGSFVYSQALVASSAPLPAANTACVAKLTSQGCRPAIFSVGAPSISGGDPLVIAARSVTPSVRCMALWSPLAAATPFAGGMLCVAAPVRRWPVAQSGSGAADPYCSNTPTASVAITIPRAAFIATGLLPGQSFHAQIWFRDNGYPAPDNIGLTNSLVFVVWP